MRVYLAAPLFSQVQRAWNRYLAEAIASALPDVTVILPQDFRTEGKYNDPKHYPALFRRCVAELTSSDAVLAVLDGAEVDSGVSFEMGVAHATGKVVIGIRTDFRPGTMHGVNLMPGAACRYVVREFAFQEDPDVVAKAVVRRLRRVRTKLV